MIQHFTQAELNYKLYDMHRVGGKSKHFLLGSDFRGLISPELSGVDSAGVVVVVVEVVV